MAVGGASNSEGDENSGRVLVSRVILQVEKFRNIDLFSRGCDFMHKHLSGRMRCEWVDGFAARLLTKCAMAIIWTSTVVHLTYIYETLY